MGKVFGEATITASNLSDSLDGETEGKEEEGFIVTYLLRMFEDGDISNDDEK